MSLKLLIIKNCAVITTLLVVFSKFSFAEDLSLVKTGTFTIAHDDSFAPFGFAEKNSQGKYNNSVGFEIDLLKKVAEKIGLKAEFQPNAWAKVLVSVKVGTADAIATIGINDERKKSYDYSEPYAKYAAILFIPKDKGLSKLSELNGKKLGIQKNHFSVPWIRAQFPKIEQVTFENAKDCFLATLSGKVEGAVADKLVGLYTINQNSELKGKLKFVGDEFASTPVALAFAKGQKVQLRKKFNEALNTFQKSNDSEQIFNKWFGTSDK
ncbi:substrate-binding periplasmic protein [Silvanigrella aquatica]|uniref:Solute-binding protein family 3/N-terminal domain-containing protein n=1 Tax=Silvanigrella aquatica TaxID=1915309 RepID=A0A1L4D0V8_9BACT|nr:transporter substrate-binding domain-containing protein [Silvanigrella aquatica]APJ03852.1 hypothetical protein AXG55_08010 [Silvanigrella aquatica]